MFTKRYRIVALVLTLCVFFLINRQLQASSSSRSRLILDDPLGTEEEKPQQHPRPANNNNNNNNNHNKNNGEPFNWANVPQRYPISSTIPIPKTNPKSIPTIQHRFREESDEARRVRIARLEAVKSNFTHAWGGYKQHAWLKDEVAPLSGKAYSAFGGWAATLVDSLDTLWIMGLRDEFEEAVEAVNYIDFTHCSLKTINVFETTIRYLGGLLGAYDISGAKYPSLLNKATELGQMLYAAFDTPNRMPITRWDVKDAMVGEGQEEAGDTALVAELGSLTLEFTRLTQLTGDPKYFDAVQRVMDVFAEQQSKTKLPGLWPIAVNAKTLNFGAYGGFTIGGMVDSLYEYLPKQYLLLGGGSQQYRKMYQDALVAMKRNIFFRPMTKGGEDILLPGDVDSNGQTHVSLLETKPRAQHLSCFSGGMVGLAAKAFNTPTDMDTAAKLVEGCLWAYESSNMGFMPEIMHTVRCDDRDDCSWDEAEWLRQVDEAYSSTSAASSAIEKAKIHNLSPGVTKIDDPKYGLRPEAIESIFLLYRLTGNPALPHRAWAIFQNTIKYTITDIGHAELQDCTDTRMEKMDRMESFWLAETLKYFYLMFEEPGVVSLDEFVLNTEAHPLRWRGVVED
ncbi:hypothetical protein AJ80_00540 [Polytolypa hystricis UAMH7299]|uniref:alpha-1,2-Mannosidase n=1 Tax=Polytolypa hystricis (strain UAMH7299) TaxID=1447883 RepID=A0A2B7Z3W9_POLH7|nr:hypothetical protein AJ80_00540 [Polytolypa hystricis UAMH7299]